MIRPVRLLFIVALVVLAACGASTRERALRASYVTVTSVQAGFLTWDRQHIEDIANAATSLEQGRAELQEYQLKRAPVMDAFAGAYHAIAAALMAEDATTLDKAQLAYDELVTALNKLTGGKLP